MHVVIARPGRGAVHFLLLIALISGQAQGQTVPSAALSSSPESSGVFSAVGAEARRYGADTVALVKASLSWNVRDWEKAAGVVIIFGGLLASDRTIDTAIQRNRSPATDGFSRATTPFGTTYAVGISAALLAGGLVANKAGVRDTGRDAIEASLLSALLTNLVLKPVAGRERPFVSNGRTDFDAFSSNASFPSGHTTEAFAVAAVVSRHADGWVIPTLSYTLASLVAFDRMNDHVHFASDVFFGAVVGMGIGRFVTRRHEPREDDAVSWDVMPIAGGIGLRLSFR